MFELEPALRRVIEMEGSDLHLKVPSKPLIRLHGRLEPIPGSDPLTPEDTEMVLLSLLGKDKHKLEEFTDENEVDFSFGVSGSEPGIGSRRPWSLISGCEGTFRWRSEPSISMTRRRAGSSSNIRLNRTRVAGP